MTSPLNSSSLRTSDIPAGPSPSYHPHTTATPAVAAPSPVIGQDGTNPAATPSNVFQRQWTPLATGPLVMTSPLDPRWGLDDVRVALTHGEPLLVESPPPIQELEPAEEMLRQHCKTPESTRRIISSRQIGAWLVDLANTMSREGIVRSDVLLATDVHAMSLQLEWNIGSDGARRMDVAVSDLHHPSFKPRETVASTDDLRAFGARLLGSSTHEATLASNSHASFDASNPLQYFGAGNSVSEYSRAIGFAIARNMPQTVHALVDRMHQNELSDDDREKAAVDISLGLSTGIRFGFDVEAGVHALHRLKLSQEHLLSQARILTRELHHAMRDDRPAFVLSYGRMLHTLHIHKAAVLALLSAESKHSRFTPVRTALVDNEDDVSLNALRAYGAVMKLHQLAQDDVIRLMESKDKSGKAVLHECLDEVMVSVDDSDTSDAELIEMARLYARLGQVFLEVLLDHDIEPARIDDVLGIEAMQAMQAMSDDTDEMRRTALVLKELKTIDKARQFLLDAKSKVMKAQRDKTFTASGNHHDAIQSIAKRWPYILPLDQSSEGHSSVDFSLPWRP